MLLFELPTPHVPLALSVLKGIAHADGQEDALEHELLALAARLYGARSIDIDALPPAEPEAIAGRLSELDDRRRLLQAALVMALADGDTTKAESQALDRLSRALEVDDATRGIFTQLAHGHPLRARLSYIRTARKTQTRIFSTIGVGGMLRMLLWGSPYQKEVPELAWRYRTLGLLPEGTLGRAFWVQLRSHGFAFPGEVGGLPAAATGHDALHVLTGYGTDPAGELRVLACTAGMKQEDPFLLLFMALSQFHAGVRIAPVAEPTRGLFEPEAVAVALRRGHGITVDITDPDWDLFEWAERPLEQVRAAIGLVSEDEARAAIA